MPSSGFDRQAVAMAMEVRPFRITMGNPSMAGRTKSGEPRNSKWAPVSRHRREDFVGKVLRGKGRARVAPMELLFKGLQDKRSLDNLCQGVWGSQSKAEVSCLI